jgi:hypothetical protein
MRSLMRCLTSASTLRRMGMGQCCTHTHCWSGYARCVCVCVCTTWLLDNLQQCLISSGCVTSGKLPHRLGSVEPYMLLSWLLLLLFAAGSFQPCSCRAAAGGRDGEPERGGCAVLHSAGGDCTQARGSLGTCDCSGAHDSLVYARC